VHTLLAAIWQTKYTEDSRDREMLIKTQLRELVVYLVFLTTLCISTLRRCVQLGFHIHMTAVSFGMTSSSTFYLTNTINGVFISQTTPAFTDIGNMDDFWNVGEHAHTCTHVQYLYGSGTTDFLQLGLLSNIYDEEWYDGTVKTGDDANSVFFENKLLGVPRLRCVRG
jgi:polycystin 2